MFIHTVRFWSMAAIVILHSAGKFTKYQYVSLPVMSFMMQPFKFATIGFFIISGFLLGDRLPETNRFAYIRRRANRLLPAWALWFGLEVLLVSARDLHGHASSLHAVSILSSIWANTIKTLVESAFWYVPNFLVALTCIVMLRRWLNDLRLGAVLLAINLFYGVNVYTRWLPSRHTEALFGFVFYLWLGAWCAHRKERVQSWAAERSAAWLVFWACVAAGISLFEVAALQARNSPDVFNSLRFGNQIYSVLIVILLVRIRRRTWPAFINVAETTYGIHLTHGMIVVFVFAAAMNIVLVSGHVLGTAGILLMWLLLAPTSYFISLQVTRILASGAGRAWTVGAASLQPRNWVVTTRIREKFFAQPTELDPA